MSTRKALLACLVAWLAACGTPTQSGEDAVAADLAATADEEVAPMDADAQDVLDAPGVDAATDASAVDAVVAGPDSSKDATGEFDTSAQDSAIADATLDTAPQADTIVDAGPQLDATIDAPDVTQPPPALTMAALQTALKNGDAKAAAPLLAQYDMPVCNATQCLFIVVAPGAKTVAVTGDWANWATDAALTYAPAAGVWWAVIPLTIVKHVEYKVKLDGQWALDPSNPYFAWNTYGPNSAIYGVNQSRLRRFAAVQSPQLGNSRDIYVYLPAAYFQQPDAHFPVLYLQDGFNVFTNPKAPYGSWDIEQTADALMASGGVQPVVFVAVDTADRQHEYVYAPLNVSGVVFEPKLPDYTAFLIDTLKPLIDSNLRTLPDRLHTAMGGSSLGGISSMWIGWTHWQTFGLVASFSGAYWIGETGAVWNGTKTGDGPPMRTLIADKAKAPPVGSVRIYMDSGDTGFDGVANYDGDAWIYSDWTRNALIAAGWDARTAWQTTSGVTQPANLPLTTALAQVPSIAWTATPAQGWKAYVQPQLNLFDVVGHGHQHNEAAWKQRFGAMLRFLWPGPALK